MKFFSALNFLLSSVSVAQAFVVQRTSSSPGQLARPVVSGIVSQHEARQSAVLWMSEESSEENVDTEARSGEEAQEEAVEEEPAEDPELLAIKEEIAKLESTLKEKRRELAYTSDKAEEYSKSGYARKVAEMENMRRARSMLASSNKSGAMAGVLTSFVPVLDTLGELQDKYGEDEFGKSYNALQSVMRQVFTDLGAAEYSVAVGDKVDETRMVVVESQYSEEFPANTVIRPLVMGWELQGNVIRAAQCVASLGPEVTEEQAPEEPAEDPNEPLE
eukprot:scaffold7349_cov173-Amphora_coffeaeformis.AAC.110